MNNLLLLDKVLTTIPNEFFSNTLLIGCQHLLPSTCILMDSLISKGLLRENIYLIGKCYSTSLKTYQEFNKKNIYVCPSSLSFNSHESYYSAFKGHISNFLNHILLKLNLKEYDKIIILDDGGELHLQFNQIAPKGLNIYGVEQTSFGFHKLKNLQLKYNIINVARSKAKLLIESDFVAESIYKSLCNVLEKNNIEKILIFGNGTIGSAVSKKLKPNYEVVRYDLDFNKSDFEQCSLSAMMDSQLIIGCSGRNILGALLENKLLVRKPILASASSFDIEFDGCFFRKNVPKNMSCHDNISTEYGILLNGGFPVNFSGSDNDGIPLKDLQITLALLLLGMIQNNQRKSISKIIELDKNLENKLINYYYPLEHQVN